MSEDEAHGHPSKTTADDAETSKPSKRPRTILACLACRQKKRRCDGGRPRCQRCVRTTTSCEYSVEFYAVPPAEAAVATQSGDSDHGVPASGSAAPVDISLHQSRQHQQLNNASFDPPPLAPVRCDDTAGPSFRFDPDEWKSDIQPRKNALPSPNDTGARVLGTNIPDPGRMDSATYNTNFSNTTQQQAFPTSDGLPDSNGLDEWTQLFLKQVFMPAEQPDVSSESRWIGQPGPSSYNLHPAQAQQQRQLPSDHSPNPFLSTLRDTVSPQRSNGLSKRVGKFRIPYFRVTCEVSAPPSPTHDPLPLEPSTNRQDYFDATGEVPNAAALQELLPIFEQRFGYFFCFISVARLQEKIRNEEASPILLNAICAISARYSRDYASQTPGDNPEMQTSSTSWSRQHNTGRATAYSGDVFAQKAKSQALKVLAVSDLDVCAALMILSWNEFGCDRDTGLWMYSGMAERMSVDCGLDQPPTQLDSEEDWTRLKFFYCLHLMDSIMVIGTGRQGSFGDVLPSVVTFPLIEGTNLHDPFPFLLEEPARSDELAALQPELVDIGSLMPKKLQFSIQNLQPYVSVGKSAGFIFMHLWFHTLVILFYAPSIVSDSQDVVQEEGRDVALSSAKSISDIAAFAELVDPQAITQPFVNYPFFTAGRLFVKETLLYVQMSADDSTVKSKPALALLKASARQNYERMKMLLTRLEFYWAGVRYITAALTQKAEGVGTAGLDIAEEGPNVTLVTALNSKAKAARVVVPSDPNWFGFGLTGAFNSPTDQAITILRPQTHQGQMTAYDGMGMDLATVRDVTIPYGRNPYEWENIAKWIDPR
ncbi:hypothetical protein QFC21_006209 [Naganishia friedmannii]|uniref:Uncharacterized protein n=1 Tax=Naganishia friedmannii TaxID=89922 RepID=A0ACC2V400_9TREE|nr:hypothetical protein QFC21_006209 [Naganishia friedmannii]